jgi:hypothetical protein
MRSKNGAEGGDFVVSTNENIPIIEPLPFGNQDDGSGAFPDRPSPSSDFKAGAPRQPYVFEPPQYEPPPMPPNHKPKPIIGRARVKHTRDSYVLIDGVPALQFEFSIAHAGNSSGTTVRVSVRAVLDGTQLESEPPVGGSTAQIMHWIDPNGTIYASSDEIFIGLEPPGNWYVIISFPDDMMVGVEFKAEARAAEWL